MRTNKFLLLPFGAAVVIGLMMGSCRKQQTTDNDTSSASDNAFAEQVSNDITNIGAQASESGALSSYRVGNDDNVLASCATIAIDTTNKIVTVTFNGGTCMDGRVRSGSLTYNYSASTNGARYFRDPGFSCTVTSNNYVVSGYQVNIESRTIANTTPVGFNPATTNLTWSVVSSLQIIKPNNTGTVTWNCNRTVTLLNTSDNNVYHGSSLPITWYLARIGDTGSANGVDAAGENYTLNVTSMLIRDFGGCTVAGRHPFIQGTFDFTPGTHATRHVDFGNGSCDATATVTINNHTYTVTLL